MQSLFVHIVVSMSTLSGNNNEFPHVNTSLATAVTFSQKLKAAYVQIDPFDAVNILGRYPYFFLNGYDSIVLRRNFSILTSNE